MTNRLFGAVLLSAAVGLFGCKKDEASGGQAGGPSSIKIDGSSTVFPIMEAMAEEYGKTDKNTRVTVGISGTGGGFKKFCTGEIDISNASRPIKGSELELCEKNGVKFVELPIALDGVAVAVHPKNDWVDHLTVAELKKIWEPEAQGKIMKWSQVREGWPDRELHLYGAGVDSGTYDYFTEAAVGKEHSSRGDYTSSEDDNVLVQGIANDEGALGFFGYAYYEENKERLKAVPIEDGKDENGKGPIPPSPETVRNGTYQPLSRPIFYYVSEKSLGRPEISGFVKFVNQNAGELVREIGYIALPGQAYALAQARADRRQTGSVFGGKGSQVGVSIEELLKSAGEKPQAQ